MTHSSEILGLAIIELLGFEKEDLVGFDLKWKAGRALEANLEYCVFSVTDEDITQMKIIRKRFSVDQVTDLGEEP